MSTDSTKEAMPFNDHTPLPWATVHEVPPLGGREYWVGIHLTDRVSQIDAFTSHDKDTSTFILHACNTYYDRERDRQQDKARIEELARLVQELVDAIALTNGADTPTLQLAALDARMAVLSKANKLGFTPSTT